MSQTSSPHAAAPAVSVLIPTYNRADYLAESVRSVLAQTFADIEVIVVDDGSTDDTGAVLSGIDDPRLRVLRREHAGCSRALNAGLAAARGRYIARNDSDDVWLPHLLATLLPVLEGDPAVGLVYGRCEGIHADGTPSGATRGFPLRYSDDAFCSLLYADYTAGVASLYAHSCLREVGGYDPTADASSDWDLALRVARRFRVRFVDRVVARIRQHAGNWTSLQAQDLGVRIVERRAVLDRAFADRSLLSPRAQRMRPVAYRNLHIGSALQWLSAGDHRAAARALTAAVHEGGNPLATAARALWSAAVWFGFSRNAVTARLAYALLRRVRVGRSGAGVSAREGRGAPLRGRRGGTPAPLQRRSG